MRCRSSFRGLRTGKPAAAKSARDGKKIKRDSDARLEDTKENLSSLLAPVNVEMERETSPGTGEGSAEGGASEIAPDLPDQQVR